MKIKTLKNNDNSEFIAKINAIAQKLISKWNPNDLFITRVDNWFDTKWLKFSGTIMHEIAVWKGETTIPPFHPNRIENSKFYKNEKGVFTDSKISEPLHIYQESKSNLKRKIVDFTKNGLLIWYSGNSNLNNKGVLMCYYVINDDCFAFHITLSGEINWNIKTTKGISKTELDILLNEKR